MTTRARRSEIVNAKDRTGQLNSEQRGASLVGRRAFYQIEIHLSRTDGLTLDELDVALRCAQDRLAPGVA